MFWKNKKDKDAASTLEAINKSMSVIEFDISGNILKANNNFLNATGYTEKEVVGQHHRMFVDPDYAQSGEYSAFWGKLGRGEFDAAEYKRLAKGGREIWIQATYNPVLTSRGKVTKVIKFAADITSAKMKAADDAGKLAAIARAQAVIEFTIDGEILTANENFCAATGYDLGEIQGCHHRMFVEHLTGRATNMWSSGAGCAMANA